MLTFTKFGDIIFNIIFKGYDDLFLKYEDCNKELTEDAMNENIKASGGLFYQYRPCNVNINTMYDIDNIRNHVVYSQSPLNMNDPFDSNIGFSEDIIYDELISFILEDDELKNSPYKKFIQLLLRSKLLNQIAIFIAYVNKTKKYISEQQVHMHLTHIPIVKFIKNKGYEIYKKAPKTIKAFDYDIFVIIAVIIPLIKEVNISENNILSFLNIESSIEDLNNKILEIKKNIYLPQLQQKLSKMNVSCFSTSGWNNQLMWSHYANSYKGICVEYDFNKLSQCVGFIYPVNYTSIRPTIKLHDLGFIGYTRGKEKFDMGEANLQNIIQYLVSKNECWKYEEEWRIINTVNTPNTPSFINVPFIKSVTIGVNISDEIKQLLILICNEIEIPLFQLTLSNNEYNLNREKIETNIDKQKTIDIITSMLSKQNYFQQQIIIINKDFNNKIKNNTIDIDLLLQLINNTNKYIFYIYYIKLSFKSLIAYESYSTINNITQNNLDYYLKNISKLNEAIIKFANIVLSPNVIQKILELISLSEFMSIKNNLNKIIEQIAKYKEIELV